MYTQTCSRDVISSITAKAKGFPRAQGVSPGKTFPQEYALPKTLCLDKTLDIKQSYLKTCLHRTRGVPGKAAHNPAGKMFVLLPKNSIPGFHMKNGNYRSMSNSIKPLCVMTSKQLRSGSNNIPINLVQQCDSYHTHQGPAPARTWLDTPDCLTLTVMLQTGTLGSSFSPHCSQTAPER